MHVSPYLLFAGDCEAALTFYARVLGGEVLAMTRHADTPAAHHTEAGWQDKIIHGRIMVQGQMIMASDAPPGRQQAAQGFNICLSPATVEEAERIFAALGEDARNVIMPLQATFWAHRFGMLVDRFGTPWMVNCERPAGEFLNA